MLNRPLFADREPEKSAAIQTHEQLGTVRIGAFGNHCSHALLDISEMVRREIAGKSRIENVHNKPAGSSHLWKNFISETLIHRVAPCFQPHAMARRMLKPKAKGRQEVKVTKRRIAAEKLMTGDTVPTSGVYGVDHEGCSELIWMRIGERLPHCPGCRKYSVFVLQQEVHHISEDPDFL